MNPIFEGSVVCIRDFTCRMYATVKCQKKKDRKTVLREE